MATKITVSLKAANPPYAVLAAARALKTPVEINFDSNGAEDVKVAADGKDIVGTNAALRYLGRVNPDVKLYGGDAVKSAQVDYWLDFVQDSLASATDYKAVACAFEVLNTHLTLRSFVVGYNQTIADFATWGALRGNAIFMRQLKAGKGLGTYLSRWFQHIASLEPVQSAIAEFDKSKTGAKPVKKDQGSFDIELKGAEMGKVVTRFPPEPSGYLHIGHAKAALLNDYFAKTYKGKLIVRFDDTNPTKEKAEFEESIKQDLLLLGIKADVITYTSDSFDKIYDYALEMIKKGAAYVDDTDLETMRLERGDCIESKCRNQSLEEALRRFEEMTKGTDFGLKCCLRAKIDMKSENGTLRDPVMYRCNLLPHHRTGNKWKVYPTYDFACPIVDALEGVTHALRTNEYRDRNPQYEWFLKALNLRWVHIWDYSRLNFIYTLLSKRKLTWFVQEGLVTGWDDPRFPTIRGIRRRGLTIEALRQYILMQGASQRDLMIEWDKIWAVNKKVIDPVAPRHTAISSEKIVKVRVVGEKVEPHTKDMPKHKKNLEVGTKKTTFSGELYLEQEDAKDLEVNEEVTFMDWGNVIVQAVNKATDGSVESIDIKLNLEGDFKKTKKKLTWLSAAATGKPEQTPVKATLFDYDYLITKKKLEEEDDVKDFVTPVTEFKVEALGDANLRLLKKGDIIQLERKGYYIVDRAFEEGNTEASVHLISIPDGKIASTQSKVEEQAESKEGSKKEGKKAAKEGGEKKAKGEKGKDAAKPAAAVGNKMYHVKPVYAALEKTDPKSVSKMYVVKNVYGFEDENVAPHQQPHDPAHQKFDKAVEAGPDKAKATKGKVKPEKPAAAPAAAADSGSLISKLDIVVGKVLSVKKHPDADSLYVEQIDVGEEKPREVVSGLVKYMREDEINGKTILVLKNLKPAAMRGIKSYAMVMCASNADHSIVEFLVPPEGSVPGDRVFFEGHEGEPEAQLNPKKKIFETVQPQFTTRDDLVATWNGVPFQTKKGLVKAATLAAASIK
ncbi:hypothetical protein HK097_009954 [Rhizophlyctis rosea]|uniref:Probable glutamate--tRNA ligase, cytoplasmic n=1 Tax=Rhizophlyctis rosea TaxID=64517 RepID=A0AAD5X437_9FUNG|nr:hypothetical protein HK097_009954 [Rhizophlyctis rosea]